MKTTWVIKLDGQVIWQTGWSEQHATIMCIALRRAGFGFCYVERA